MGRMIKCRSCGHLAAKSAKACPNCGGRPYSITGKLVLFLTIIFFLLIATVASRASDVVVDIRAIAGKSESELAAVLGAPSSCEKSKYGKRCYYTEGQSEVVFIDAKADWITVNDMGPVQFLPSAIRVLGLNEQTPSIKSQSSMRWRNISGIREVSMFLGSGGRIDYAYIKVSTE